MFTTEFPFIISYTALSARISLIEILGGIGNESDAKASHSIKRSPAASQPRQRLNVSSCGWTPGTRYLSDEPQKFLFSWICLSFWYLQIPWVRCIMYLWNYWKNPWFSMPYWLRRAVAGCVQNCGARFNYRRDSVLIEPRSGSILIAVGKTHGKNDTKKLKNR